MLSSPDTPFFGNYYTPVAVDDVDFVDVDTTATTVDSSHPNYDHPCMDGEQGNADDFDCAHEKTGEPLAGQVPTTRASLDQERLSP